MKERLDKIFDAARIHKKSLGIAIDTILVILSLCLAYLIRLGSIDKIEAEYINQIIAIAVIIIPLKLIIFWFFHLYHISFRYISIREVLSVIMASALSSPMIAFAAMIFRDVEIFKGFPRSVVFIDFFLTVFLITGIRAFFRLYYSSTYSGEGKRTLIFGAGSAGEKLVRDMTSSPQYGYLPIGFADDNPLKQKILIHGIKVYGSREDIPKIVEYLDVEELMIAIPSATSKEIRGIMEYVRKAKIKDIKVLPGLSELIDGKISINDIRNITIEDLLGREPVEIDTGLLSSFLPDKNILVTGAGGSIGSELCRQVARFSPGCLIMLDIGETELFYIDRELREKYPDLYLKSIVGDIKDEKNVEKIFKESAVNTVFHAAAYKHVPLMEANPREAILNNIYGTKVLGSISARHGVERFVFISTDKAVNPTSVMGATKRVCENLIRGLNSSRTVFASVRFGNVIGSRGSVVRIFQEQIRNGGPITITDREMKRYFMTIPEAAQLVMQAGAIGKGGDVFVLDMGEPVSIYQMAEDLIKLSGLEPDKDIPIIFSGKRPGEKLFEELLTAEEGTSATLYEKIHSAKILGQIDKGYEKKIDKLISLAREDKDRGKIFLVLKDLVPTYQHSIN